jgi:hypothetical protein
MRVSKPLTTLQTTGRVSVPDQSGTFSGGTQMRTPEDLFTAIQSRIINARLLFHITCSADEFLCFILPHGSKTFCVPEGLLKEDPGQPAVGFATTF